VFIANKTKSFIMDGSGGFLSKSNIKDLPMDKKKYFI